MAGGEGSRIKEKNGKRIRGREEEPGYMQGLGSGSSM